MKRMHIHVAVEQLVESIKFYSTMFDVPPTIERDDYAKWELNDPAVNFAISKRGNQPGINHLGIQTDSVGELEEISRRLDDANITSSNQSAAECCYARSDKHWILDPQGIAWETFYTHEQIPFFGEDSVTTQDTMESACCIPLRHDQSNSEAAACCVPNENSSSNCCA